jgi:hypothetical protein
VDSGGEQQGRGDKQRTANGPHGPCAKAQDRLNCK